MNRNLFLFGGVVTALGVASAMAVTGHNARACTDQDKAASTTKVSSCCARGEATAASAAKASSSCARGEATAASATCAHKANTAAAHSGCTRNAVHTAGMTNAVGCDQAHATAASACEGEGAAAAASTGSCCKAGEAKSASASGSCDMSKESCDGAKSAFNGKIDTLPYAANKRVVLTGTYACGHCNMHVTEDCSPMFKTTDGKVYPLLESNESDDLRAADTGNGVEIATMVKKIDGVKYLQVKSYKTL